MLGRALIVAGCMLATACSQSSRPADPQPPPDLGAAAAAADATERSPTMKIQDAANSTKEFTRGPTLVPTADLVAWLEATRADIGQRRVRLPIWIELRGPAIASARIGAADGPDAVKVKIRDGAMGISIVDRARHASRDGAPAALWLEGLWQGNGRFEVLRFVKAISPAEADAASYVEIEPAP